MRVLSQVGTSTTYNVTRNLDGTDANDWAEGQVFGNWGQRGDGRVEMYAYETPRMSVYSHGVTYNDHREQVRIGDLGGNWGYGTAYKSGTYGQFKYGEFVYGETTYGAAFGSYEPGKANITIDPINGIRLKNYDTTIIQLNGDIASFENTIYL